MREGKKNDSELTRGVQKTNGWEALSILVPDGERIIQQVLNQRIEIGRRECGIPVKRGIRGTGPHGTEDGIMVPRKRIKRNDRPRRV